MRLTKYYCISLCMHGYQSSLLALFLYTGGCGRSRSEEERGNGELYKDAVETERLARDFMGSHKMSCTPHEMRQTRCQNGGTCFALILDTGMSDTGCR